MREIRDASEDILEDIYENQIYKVEEIEAAIEILVIQR